MHKLPDGSEFHAIVDAYAFFRTYRLVGYQGDFQSGEKHNMSYFVFPRSPGRLGSNSVPQMQAEMPIKLLEGLGLRRKGEMFTMLHLNGVKVRDTEAAEKGLRDATKERCIAATIALCCSPLVSNIFLR